MSVELQESSPLSMLHPRLRGLLADAVAAYLESPEQQSFEQDSDFMASFELLLDLAQTGFDCERALRTEALKSTSSMKALEDAQAVVDNLRSLTEKLREQHQRRMGASASAPLPRLIRLAGRIGLSDKEIFAVAFIAMRNRGELGCEEYERRGDECAHGQHEWAGLCSSDGLGDGPFDDAECDEDDA